MFKTRCSFLIKTQEEQTTSSKGSRQKTKEKTDQTRETQKEKRRMASNRKGLSGGTSGTIAPLSDVEQNNFSGQHSQEKFPRWASEQPREGKGEAPDGGCGCHSTRWEQGGHAYNPSRTGLLPDTNPVFSWPEGSVLTLKACVVIFRLNHFRWIVPANGEVTLRVHFSSNDLGIFDQTFNFEILGTHRQYQLYCRGVCTYPYICQDPK